MELRSIVHPRRGRGPTRRRRERGTSMLEMAIVAPVLLMLLFGIAEFGVAFAWWQTLANAAREGARVGVVYRNPCETSGEGQNDADYAVRTAVTSYAATLIPDSVSFDTIDGLCLTSGTPVTVQVSVPYTFQTLPGLAGVSPNITLRATSVMRNE